MIKAKNYLLLHIMLMVYSISGIFSKKAALVDFLSFDFCLYYSGVIILLGLYAICWQQIIKVLPLTSAFANKAVTIIWGIVWGALFFGEKISAGKIISAIVVIIGIVILQRKEVYCVKKNKRKNSK